MLTSMLANSQSLQSDGYQHVCMHSVHIEPHVTSFRYYNTRIYRKDITEAPHTSATSFIPWPSSEAYVSCHYVIVHPFLRKWHCYYHELHSGHTPSLTIKKRKMQLDSYHVPKTDERGLRQLLKLRPRSHLHGTCNRHGGPDKISEKCPS